MNGIEGIFKEMRNTRMEALSEECSSKKSEVDEALEIEKKATNGKAFTVTINGNKYSYYPTEESGLTAKELGEKYSKIAKYSQGKALAWLKKNATTKDSYRKIKESEKPVSEEEDDVVSSEKPVSEEEDDVVDVEEKASIDIDAKEILKAATAIEKAESDGKEVKVTITVDGIDVQENEPEDEIEEAKDDVCPECGENPCKCKSNEEVDVAELAIRLDECQGSEYMKTALQQGKISMVEKYLQVKEMNEGNEDGDIKEIPVKNVKPGNVIRSEAEDVDFEVESVDFAKIEKTDNSCCYIRGKVNGKSDMKVFDADDNVFLVR